MTDVGLLIVIECVYVSMNFGIQSSVTVLLEYLTILLVYLDFYEQASVAIDYSTC